MGNTILPERLAPEKTITGAEAILIYLKNLPGTNWFYYMQTLKEAVWLDAQAGVVFIENALSKRELLEAFVFNPEQQVHIFKQGQSYKAAVTKGGQKEDTEIQYIESDMVLWGCYKKTENGFHYFTEGRGMITRVSKELLQIPAEPENIQLRLKQRDYIHFDEETLQAGFLHCRFISLTLQ